MKSRDTTPGVWPPRPSSPLKPLSIPKPAYALAFSALKLPTPAPAARQHSAPPVSVIGDGVAVVMVGDVIRIDVMSDDGTERCTRFVTIEEAKRLNVLLARLCR